MSFRTRIFAAAGSCCLLAPVAAASTGSASVKLTPDRRGAASSLSVSARGPFDTQGTPTAVRLLVQKGFSSSPKSVAVLCTAGQESSDSCPAASRIGSGTAVVTGTLGTTKTQDTVDFTMFLGQPLARGDIASVHITGSDSVLHQSAHATGRLFKSGGRLEILFKPLPQYAPPPGTTVTLDSLSLKAGASRTVITGTGRRRRRRTYSLITNPPTCPKGGWTSELVVSFASGSDDVRTLNAACR